LFLRPLCVSHDGRWRLHLRRRTLIVRLFFPVIAVIAVIVVAVVAAVLVVPVVGRVVRLVARVGVVGLDLVAIVAGVVVAVFAAAAGAGAARRRAVEQPDPGIAGRSPDHHRTKQDRPGQDSHATPRDRRIYAAAAPIATATG
jgi:hypothetical protein